MFGRLAKIALKSPIHVYRWTLKPLFGWPCRHLPTCSEYGLDAIERNGAWRGFWLTVSRITRCHPWGSSGYDPAPDITGERRWLAPWSYGRWSGRHIEKGPAQVSLDDERDAACGCEKQGGPKTSDQ